MCLIILLGVNKWMIYNWIFSDTKSFLEISNFVDLFRNIYLTYMYKPYSVLNNIQWLICYKTKPNQTKASTYGHLPPITKTIQVRLTRHAGHCWRSRDEFISDVLLWIPAYGRAKVGRPARTYIQQLCEDTRCSPEDLLEAMNDREKWQERVRDIRARGTTWWWWWWWW